MWYPFKKKVRAKETESNVKIEVEDLLDQGYKCQEIATQLNIDVERVYTIKEVRKRRQMALVAKSDRQETDRISELREELQMVELNDRIDQAKHKAFLRQREREEYEMDDAEELVDDVNNPDKLIQTLLLNAALKTQNQNNQVRSPGVQAPPVSSLPPQEKEATAPGGVLDFDRIEKAVKLGLVSEEKFVREAAAINLTPEKAKKLYSFMKEGI